MKHSFLSFDTLPEEVKEQILLSSAAMRHFYTMPAYKRHAALEQVTVGNEQMRAFLSEG